MIDQPTRICVCTSNRASSEPRAPRHASALQRAGYKVTFIDAAPRGLSVEEFNSLPDLAVDSKITFSFPHRKSGIIRLLTQRISKAVLRFVFSEFKTLNSGLLSTRVMGLQRLLTRQRAHLYFAHNIDMLYPAYRAAKINNALLIFDCMEYYSDMGEGQSKLDSEIIRKIEATCLPHCILITASSQQIADAYAKEYNLERTLAIYNKPEIVEPLSKGLSIGLRLYWRNAVLGLGQRGLDDALQAMQSLPKDVTLTLQGQLQADGGQMLRNRIYELDIQDRVYIKSPFKPGEAVREASHYDVGLCLERSGNRNHELTVSNKLFDYMMAGLVVISSDLPGLASILAKSKSGVLFEPGNVKDLVSAVLRLYRDRGMLQDMSQKSRTYAIAEGNSEVEMETLVRGIQSALKQGHTM